jgi:hypothetical protein
MRFSASTEARLSGAVISTLRHFAKLYGRERVMDHIDHGDFIDMFRTDLRPAIHRELLRAKLEGVRVAPVDRERVKRLITLELAMIEDYGPPGQPKEI